MLTKSDLRAIGQLVRTVVKDVAVTKDDAKHFATYVVIAGKNLKFK